MDLCQRLSSRMIHQFYRPVGDPSLIRAAFERTGSSADIAFRRRRCWLTFAGTRSKEDDQRGANRESHAVHHRRGKEFWAIMVPANAEKGIEGSIPYAGGQFTHLSTIAIGCSQIEAVAWLCSSLRLLRNSKSGWQLERSDRIEASPFCIARLLPIKPAGAYRLKCQLLFQEGMVKSCIRHIANCADYGIWIL